MKYSIIRRLREMELVSKFDNDIQLLNLYAQDSTRMALAIDNKRGEREVFVEISWLEDVENDRYIFQVVEEYQNWMTDDDTEYKTYHFDRLIDNLLELFAKFDIYPKDYLELL
jgi:hypothetical protein